jgi:hypothetical protein
MIGATEGHTIYRKSRWTDCGRSTSMLVLGWSFCRVGLLVWRLIRLMGAERYRSLCMSGQRNAALNLLDSTMTATPYQTSIALSVQNIYRFKSRVATSLGKRSSVCHERACRTSYNASGRCLRTHEIATHIDLIRTTLT